MAMAMAREIGASLLSDRWVATVLTRICVRAHAAERQILVLVQVRDQFNM